MVDSNVETITPRDAMQAANRGDLQIVDVRELDELAVVRAVDVAHIPMSQLEQRSHELSPGKKYAILCRSGRRSQLVADALVAAGGSALNIEGGIIAWEKDGLPVIRGEQT